MQVPVPLWPGLLPNDKAALLAAAQLAADNETAKYFPGYGCSLLMVPDAPGTVSLHVVGLDQWEFHVHR